MFSNIILLHVAFRGILPPGWGALPKRNHIFHLSYFRVQGFRGSRVQGFMGSRVQGLKGSRVQGFMGSRVQGLKGSWVQGLKDFTTFDLQSQICGFQWVTGILF
jgi:hypothetical protein